MHFFSLAWALLLAGFATLALSLVISANGPSRGQMLLMWIGLGELVASMVDRAVGT